MDGPRACGRTKGLWTDQGPVDGPRACGRTKGLWTDQGPVDGPRACGRTKGLWTDQGPVDGPRACGRTKGLWPTQYTHLKNKERRKTSDMIQTFKLTTKNGEALSEIVFSHSTSSNQRYCQEHILPGILEIRRNFSAPVVSQCNALPYSHLCRKYTLIED